MVARHETHPGNAAAAGPAEFRAAVESMRRASLRPEVFCEEMPAPQRIAPWSSALSGDVTVDEEDLGTGRLILLHDPAGNDAWDGTFRCVAYARADIDPELGSDPMLAAVGWLNQVVLPAKGSERLGHQPVVHLTANGRERAEVAVNVPVNLVSQIEMPPRAGKIVQYDWYLGGSDNTFEPATKLALPQVRVNATRTVSFPKPGEYVIALRAVGERDGVGRAESTTPLINLDRVRVIVR